MIDIIKLIQEEIEDPKTVEITIRIESASIVYKVTNDNWVENHPRYKKGNIIVQPMLSDIFSWDRLHGIRRLIIPVDIGEYSVAIVEDRFSEGYERQHFLKKLIDSKIKKLFVEDVKKKAKSENIIGSDIISTLARSYKKKDILIVPDHEKFKINFVITNIKEIK